MSNAVETTKASLDMTAAVVDTVLIECPATRMGRRAPHDGIIPQTFRSARSLECAARLDSRSPVRLARGCLIGYPVVCDVSVI